MDSPRIQETIKLIENIENMYGEMGETKSAQYNHTETVGWISEVAHGAREAQLLIPTQK